MVGRLEGKVAVVTGATSGIGEATARLFAAEGARVVLAGRTVEKGEAIAAEIGDHAVFHRTDVTEERDVAALFDAAVRVFGRVDCVFNNAGGPTYTSLVSVTGDQIDEAMRLLYSSVVFGIKYAIPLLEEAGGGSIINNSSIAAHRFAQGDILYSSAKAAVSHLTHLAAVELGPRGIRVNAISPGAIATPIFWGGSQVANRLDDADNERKMAKLQQNLARATPLPRAGVADDIASAALFLASDEASFVNGHDLVIDGGRVWAYNERSS